MSAASLAEKLQAIRGPYLVSLRTKLEVLEQLDSRLQSGDFADADRRELAIQAHKIAGTAGTYGFADLGTAARGLEEHLIDHPHANAVEISKHLSILIEFCQATLAA